MTNTERAQKVLRSRGWTPAILSSCTDEEVEQLAAMSDQSGNCQPGIAAKLDAWLEEYYAARKATAE